MAIVQKASNSAAAVASFSPSLTGVTAGNTLVLLVSASGFSDTTPTDSAGQTWSKAFYLANGACQVAVYYLLSANSGTHNLTVSHGGSAYDSWSLVEIPTCTAVDLVSTLGSGSNTITTISTPSITTTNASDAIFVLMCIDSATGLSNAAITDPPTGYTSVFAQQNTLSFAGCEHGYKEVSSTGAQSATWTFGADTTGTLYAAASVAFKLSAAGGAALAGAGIATAGGSGAFAPKAQFAGAGTTTARGSATLGGGATLSGAGVSLAAGSATLTVKPQFAGTGTANASGLASLTVPVSFSVTLKQHWYQPVGQGNPATLTFGSNPLTATAGSTLVVVTSGADLGTQPPPTDGSGTFTIPTNGRQNLSGSDHIWCSIAYQANASGGSHTITPGAVGSGSSGEIAHWILEITNMPATANVRGVFFTAAINSSGSWSVSSDTTVQAGDIAIVMGMYENTSPLTLSDLSDPPSGWTSVGHSELSGTAFTPTTVAYQVVPTSGTAVTANYSTTDPTISEHISIMLVMVPNASGMTLTGSGIAGAAGSGALTVKSQFAAASATAAAGSAALTTRAALAGAGLAAAAGAGALSNGVSFAVAGSAPAIGAGVLTVRAALAGAGAAGAIGAAVLTTGGSGAALAGAGSAAAAGSAALTVAAALAGAGIATAGGVAALSGGSAAANFAGAGVASATGSGALTTRAALAGGGFSIATAAGVLTIGGGGVAFVGNGAASTAGAAALTARPRFAGAGAASAAGSGALAIASPFAPGNEAVWLVPARNTVAVAPSRQTVAQAMTD